MFLKGRRAETNIIGASGVPQPTKSFDVRSVARQKFFLETRDSLFGQILRKDHHFLATEVGCKRANVLAQRYILLSWP